MDFAGGADWREDWVFQSESFSYKVPPSQRGIISRVSVMTDVDVIPLLSRRLHE